VRVATPPWLPTIAIAACAWLALFPITSVDAYYHLATGRRILDEHAIPHRGVGSATFGAAPWHDSEWGFQVLAALVGRAEVDPSGVLVLTPAGRAGLVVLRAAMLAATLALLSAAMTSAGVGPALRALAVWLAAFLTFGNLYWDIRPQIFSYAAFAAVAYLLERRRHGVPWALPAALVVVALWANVHGAFVVGLGLIACDAAGAWIEAARAPARRAEAWSLTAAAAAAPLAACVNPAGVSQLLHPFVYLRRPEIYAGNNEWTRPDLLHLPLLVTTLALLAGALAAGARPRPAQLLRVALFSALALSAIRHLPFAALAIVPVLAEAAGAWGERAARWPTARSLGALALASAAIVGLSGAKFIGLVPRFAEQPSRALPEHEVRTLAAIPSLGPGFNAYRFGGFLAFRLYPREVVFMDGRNDLYGTFRTEVYDRIRDAAPGWRAQWDDAIARYRLRWVLIDASEPLAAELATDPAWRRAPDDGDGIVLFLHVASTSPS
jgi:hypothetical protein